MAPFSDELRYPRDLGRPEQGDSFLNDRFPDLSACEHAQAGLKADYILANPPFNIKRWGGEHLREDKRWK